MADMMNPYSLELSSTLLSLAATYLTGKESRGEVQDAAAFRHWLEHEAFPLLLERADQTLTSVISMKAGQHEQLRELLGKVNSIHKAVVAPSPAAALAMLESPDRALLLHMLASVGEEGPFQHFELGDLETALNASAAEIVRSVQWLKEKGWMRIAEFTGRWSCSPTAAGLYFAWTATDPSAAETIERLRGALPDRNSSERLGSLADAAGVPIGLAYSTVRTWADQGLLTFNDKDWPLDQVLVHGVQESLRRGTIAPDRSHE